MRSRSSTTTSSSLVALALSTWTLSLSLGCTPAGVTPDAGPGPGKQQDAGDPESDAGTGDDAGTPPGDDAGDDAGDVDGGAPGGDAGEGEEDAGPPPPGPTAAAREHLGAYLPAANVSLLVSQTSDRVLFGYQGVPVPPFWLGLEDDDAVPTGLLVLDRASGEVARYDDGDGLPSFPYSSPSGGSGDAAAPLFDLSWIDDGEVFVAAAWTHVVRGTFAEDGSLSFSSATVDAPSGTQDALVPRVAYASGKLFAATDHGVAMLDPETLAVLGWVDLGFGEEEAWVYELRASRLGATMVVAVLAGPPDADPSHVVVIRPNAVDEAPTVAPLLVDGAVPLSVTALPSRMLIGVLAGGEGEIRAVDEVLDGYAMSTWATSAELATLSSGSVIPAQLAYDAENARVLVGGRILPGTLAGGGLGQIFVDEHEMPSTTALDLLDRRDRYTDLLPPQVDVLVVDARGDVYVSGRRLCSESRLGRVAPLRIERQGGETRVVRPFLSGVRALATGGDGDELWVGTRDEIPGLACEGVTVAQGLCRLRADGACELYTPVANSGEGTISAAPGPSAIAFGDPARREMAVATSRDALFLRAGGTSAVVMTQIDPGLDLNLTKAAFGEPGALWIGSEMHYEEYPDPTLDEEAINRRGPHGLGYLELDGEAKITLSRRYVRDASDLPNANDVEGLWSDWVWDVLPLDGVRRAVVALGVERMDRSYDHLLPPVSPRDVQGGVAIIDDEQVSKVGAAGLDDAVALARGPHDDEVWALDADSGVYRVDVSTAHAVRFAPAPFSAPDRGVSLAVDGDGRIAVGSRRGLWVYDASGGRTQLLSGGEAGYVWALRFHDDGVLYAGTDQGLLRIALDDAALPSRGPASLSREIWDLSWGCWGELDCACSYDDECAPELACACDGVSCTCQESEPTGPVDGECALDCSCATDSGCPAGQTCQGGFAGFSCL